MTAAGASVVRFCYCGHAERRHEEEDGKHVGPCSASACGCAGMRHNPEGTEPIAPIRSITPPRTLPSHVRPAPPPVAVPRPAPPAVVPTVAAPSGGLLHRAEHSASAATRRMGQQIEAALGKLGLRLESEEQNLAARTELAACEQRAAEIRESLHPHRRNTHPAPPS